MGIFNVSNMRGFHRKSLHTKPLMILYIVGTGRRLNQQVRKIPWYFSVINALYVGYFSEIHSASCLTFISIFS